jgi:MFS family permease
MLMNGAIFRFSQALIDPSLVLTWFVSELTQSDFLIGLVVPLGNAGWFLPQIFISGYLQRQPRKMPLYATAAAVRVIGWAALAALTWLIPSKQGLLIAFFILYPLVRTVSGLNGITFFEMIAKTIPTTQRGRLFAYRQLFGGLLAIAASWVVNQALTGALGFSFPHGYAFLLTVAPFGMGIAMSLFTLIPEPQGEVVKGHIRLREQLRRAWGIAGRDISFRRYLVARAAFLFGSVAVPFYTVLAKEVLGAGVDMVAIYLVTTQAAALMSNLVWGRASDRHGNRLVLRLITAGKAITTVLALGLSVFVHSAGHGPGISGQWLPYLMLPVFALEGALQPAGVISGSNLLLEIAPPVERPVYLGFANTVLGIVLLATGMGGLLVDWFGFTGLFALTLVCHSVAFVFSTRMQEPRMQQATENAQ